MPVKPAIIPCLHYADAPAAIAFLCTAFGFERHAVHLNRTDGSIVEHAELLLQGQMIMLGSAKPDQPFWKLSRIRLPSDAGGNTQTIYVVLDDVDGHAERAREAGAEILMPPEDQSYGGRCYSARDPGGYVWSFGSYDPFAATA